MVSPSGLKRGWASKAMPLVILVAVPPAIGIVYKSPRRSNTIVWPSGLTSSDIQLTSVALNFAERSALSGSGSFFPLPLPLPLP